MTTAERVILIQGDANKWYDQAIFIVKHHAPGHQIPIDMVAEAEKIIENYMVKNNKPLPVGFPAPSVKGYGLDASGTKKRRFSKRWDFFINILMMLACLAIAGIFLYGIAT